MAFATDHWSLRGSWVQGGFAPGADVWCGRAGDLRSMRPPRSVSSSRGSSRDLPAAAAEVYQFTAAENWRNGLQRLAAYPWRPFGARTGSRVPGFSLHYWRDSTFSPERGFDSWKGW